MYSIKSSDGLEVSFWGNIDYDTNEIAKSKRDALYRALHKKPGFKVSRSVNNGQCRKYSGLGQPDGRIGNVYKLTIRGDITEQDIRSLTE